MRLAAVCLFSCASCFADGETGRVSDLAFSFEHREGMLWVNVQVPESRRVLNFLLDTGAEASVIDLKTAEELNLPLGQRAAVAGVGVSTYGYWCGTQSANANGVQLPSRLLALDLEKLSSRCERRVDGLIGADFFRSKIVQLDFEHGCARLLDPATMKLEGDAVPLELRRCGLRAKASINGKKAAWFRVDTGCASSVQWVTGSINTKNCTSKVAVGLAQVGIPQTKTSVKIGTAVFNDVDTGLHASAIFEGEAGLLGNGLLSRFKSVTIDGVAGRLLLGERR